MEFNAVTVDTTFYYAEQVTNGWQKNEKKCSSITINYLNKLGNLGCIKEQHLMPLAGREKGAICSARTT